MNAVLLTVILLCVIAIPFIIVWKSRMDNKRWKATVYLLLLVWAARFSVGIFSSLKQETGLTMPESLFDSLIHALQTFSMDEDYTVYTVAGKAWLKEIHPALGDAYGIVISVINLIAPILGGALLLSILTNIFSNAKIAVFPYRHKFVFSELNEASITLAEDIMRENHYKKILNKKFRSIRPLIVFTDAYLDDESEVSSELFNRARDIGAVCVKTDLMHLPLCRSGSVDYFLMDADSKGNISTLSGLLKNQYRNGRLWTAGADQDNPNIRMFIFTTDDFEDTMVKNICGKNDNAQKVLVRTIRDYKNMAVNLMNDVPLFLSLLHTTEKELAVTIFGSGSIGEEIFKSVFWCGQMNDIALTINVVSKDAEKLENRIRETCPELLKSTDSSSDLLKVYPFGDTEKRNPPYCKKVSFYKVDNIFEFSDIPEEVFNGTNFYVVALGTDDKNITVAHKIKMKVSRKSILNERQRYTVIVPAVYDRELAETLYDVSAEGFGPSIIPFATLESRYSCRNIFMTDFLERALDTARLYDKKQETKERDDEYTYWSNITRTVHAPYKAFALGRILSVEMDRTDEERWHLKEHVQLSENEKHMIAWMEHRRWNAFLRTQGFTCPSKEKYDQYHAYYAETGHPDTHKDLELKYHPCLVECRPGPYHLPESENFNREEYDYLDYVTMYHYYKEKTAAGEPMTAEGLRNKDYKQYDYIEHDPALREFI